MNKNPDPVISFSEAAHAEYALQFLPEMFRSATLDSFPASADAHREAVRAAWDFVSTARYRSRVSFVTYGPPCSGKTLLTSCLWAQIAPSVSCRSRYSDVMKAGTADNLLFVTAAEIPRLLQDKEQSWLVHARTAYLAVIDDLDKFPTGQWANTLLDLIDTRLVRNRLPTMFTMQITPREFACKYGDVGEAIISRMERTGGVFVRLERLPTATATKPVTVEATSTAVCDVESAAGCPVSRLQQAIEAMPRPWALGT